MATESLIVELNAKTNKLDTALNSTNKKLTKLDEQTGKNDKSFAKLTGAASAVGKALTITATAGLALATALTAIVLKSADSQRELGLLSRQAKLSTDDFEALSFATKQYGINAEQIADISKDLSDKMGEFGKAGTGAFQDYADVIGLTKEQAKEAAIEFENMSSDQVIGQMVSNMEKAGASSNEMTFALESMGNDLSRLIPLFTGNSKELNTLTGTYKKATEQMKLTSKEVGGLQTAATSFDLMTSSLSKGGNLISAQIAPLLSEFFNSVINVVPDATQTIVNFINSFKTPAEITNLVSVQNQLAEATTDLHIATLQLANTEAKARKDGLSNREKQALSRMISEQSKEVDGLSSSIEQLTAREAELNKQRVDDAKRLNGGVISATGGSTTGGSGTGGEVQAIADRFKSETDLLAEKLARELEMVGDNKLLIFELEKEHSDKLLALKLEEQEAFDNVGSDMIKLFESNKKEEAKLSKDAANDKRKIDEQYLGIATNLNSALFDDNKAVKAGIVVADTASAIMKSLSINPYDYLNVGVIATTGLAQLASINSSSKDGGSISGSSGGASAAQEEPSSTLAIDETDASGKSNSQVIKIMLESDDTETARFVANILGKASVNGAI